MAKCQPNDLQTQRIPHHQCCHQRPAFVVVSAAGGAQQGFVASRSPSMSHSLCGELKDNNNKKEEMICAHCPLRPLPSPPYFTSAAAAATACCPPPSCSSPCTPPPLPSINKTAREPPVTGEEGRQAATAPPPPQSESVRGWRGRRVWRMGVTS